MTIVAKSGLRSSIRGLATYIVELIGIGVVYFALAKVGLTLASVNPSATPIWPAAGFALAVILLRGYRVWPAILAASFGANFTNVAVIESASAIAVGNVLEALIGGWLINRWSHGRYTFSSALGVAKFAIVCLGPGTIVSALIGAGSLVLTGQADPDSFTHVGLTWWLGDLAGALVITPFVVMWAMSDIRSFEPARLWETVAMFATAVLIGLVAFSPLIEQTPYRDALGFLAIAPLVWAALRRNQRDTTTVALILAYFAVWGTYAGGGPFARDNLNDSFLFLVMFLVSISVPSLALSADVVSRRRSEDNLRRAHAELDQRIRQRTAALEQTSKALQSEVEQRQKVEAALYRDVIERRKAQLALADSERHFRMLVQGVTDSAIYMIDPDGHVTSWNSGAERIKGYTEDEIIGEHFSRFYIDQDRARREPERTIAVAASKGKYEEEGWRVKKDGTLFWASAVVEAIRDSDGVLVGFAKVTRDVTERREAQAVLEHTREQLAQSQKMEAIGQLTGGIAHDFNNLLMIVSGYSQILKNRLLDPKIMEAIEAVQTAAKRGESLTRQLLTFSRRQRLSPVVVNLRDRIDSMRPMLGSSLRGNIELIDDIPDDIWPIEVDIAELELAVLNVAVNARDAMPDGGKFLISAHNIVSTRSGGPITLEGEFVAIDLSDTGAGIPHETLHKIFDPFFTTKAVGKGTGLGLSQVYGYAHQSGGTVTAMSEVGKGTTITVYLPRSHAQVSSVGEPSDVRAGAPKREGIILVVEDNPDVAEVTSSLLDQLGFTIVFAENALDALKILEEGEPIDLVFSDIVMPGGMDGVALAQEIHKRYPGLPVLLTSGYSDAVQAAEAEFAILRKPFEISALQRVIRNALATGGAPDRSAANGEPQQRPRNAGNEAG